jgi:hypothetical protein
MQEPTDYSTLAQPILLVTGEQDGLCEPGFGFDETGACVDGSAKAQLYAVGRQMVEFALQRPGLAIQA